MPKRILIFIPCFTYGGAEKQGIILARALKERGYDVHVWAFPPIKSISSLSMDDLTNEGIHCFQFPEWPKYSWKFAERPWSLRRMLSFFRSWFIPLDRIKKIAPSEQFDVIIPFTVTACLLAVLLKERLQAKAILWNHRGGNDSAGFNYSPFIKKRILKANPVLMANSHGGAKFLGTVFSKPVTQIKVINNTYLPDNAEKIFVKSAALYSQRFEMLQLANFFPEKDWETLVEGMALLRQRGFSCHLHLVGAFLKDEDQKRFIDKTSEFGVEKMITVYGSLNRQQIIGQVLSNIHIGVLSSKTEGMPNSVMEYMYWKLPVIGTDIPGIREVLGEDQYECLFKVGDATGFADKVQWITADKERFEKIGNANHQRILNQFSVNKIMPLWIDLIDDSVKSV